jgi:hypothetical protein
MSNSVNGRCMHKQAPPWRSYSDSFRSLASRSAEQILLNPLPAMYIRELHAAVTCVANNIGYT